MHLVNVLKIVILFWGTVVDIFSDAKIHTRMSLDHCLSAGFSGNRHKLDRDEMTKAVANHFGREGFNIVVVKSGNGLVREDIKIGI